MDVDADAARRFLVTRHMLAPARSLDGGSDGVLEVFRRLGSVQFDPLAVAGRNHDLVLHARVAAYDPVWCERLYERRELFEAYNKGLSLVQTSEFPWFRAPWLGELERRPTPHPRRACRHRRAGTRTHPRAWAAVCARLRAPPRIARRLVRRADEHRPRRTRGIRRDRSARSRSAGRQPPLLRPDRATAASRDPRAQGPATRTAPPQAPVALSRARPPGHRRRRRHLQRPRPGEAGPEMARAPGSDGATRGGHRGRRARRRLGRGRSRQTLRPP